MATRNNSSKRLQQKVKLKNVKLGQVYRLICPYKRNSLPSIWSDDYLTKLKTINIGEEMMILERKRYNNSLLLRIILLGDDKIGWMRFTIAACSKWKRIL